MIRQLLDSMVGMCIVGISLTHVIVSVGQLHTPEILAPALQILRSHALSALISFCMHQLRSDLSIISAIPAKPDRAQCGKLYRGKASVMRRWLA